MKAAALFLAFACVSAQADEWTGSDKTKHFAVGAVISATSLTFTTPGNAFLIGAGVGLAKELADTRTTNHVASGKDFAVTALGAAVGAYAPGIILGRRSISYSWSF